MCKNVFSRKNPISHPNFMCICLWKVRAHDFILFSFFLVNFCIGSFSLSRTQPQKRFPAIIRSFKWLLKFVFYLCKQFSFVLSIVGTRPSTQQRMSFINYVMFAHSSREWNNAPVTTIQYKAANAVAIHSLTLSLGPRSLLFAIISAAIFTFVHFMNFKIYIVLWLMDSTPPRARPPISANEHGGK